MPSLVRGSNSTRASRAGGYAGPFISAAGFAPVWNQRGALQFHGRLEGRRWIIISHPGTDAHRYEASRSALLEALADAAG